MTDSIKCAGIPASFKIIDEKGGGSTITPLPLIQKTYPEVVPLGSNPCELPKTVIPRLGGVK